MSRIKKLLLLAGALLLLVGVYLIDVVRSAVSLGQGSWMTVREVGVFAAFLLLFFYLQGTRVSRQLAVPKNIGKLLAYSLPVLVITIIAENVPASWFPSDPDVGTQSALGTLFLSSTAIILGVFSLMALLTIRDLIYYKRKKWTKRNFLGFVVLLLAANASVMPVLPSGGMMMTPLLSTLAIILVVINSFKQNWVVYLSRREKMYSIAYTALLFLTFLGITLLINQNSLEKALVGYHAPLQSFVRLNAIFGVIYFGMAFVSTLFHLPTAEVYERKQTELTSLHNLSRLVTQVFDFSDLVDTVTGMTLEVVGANSAWLELIKGHDEKGDVLVEVVSLKNTTRQQIETIAVNSEVSLRQFVIDSKRPLVIDDVSSDRRTKHIKKVEMPVGSLICVPLASHEELIGFLHATKEFQYGFDQDDIDVLTTFADHVTIAIENSKLIARSLERERFQQEMMVAQQMQKRLLPQKIPMHPSLDVAAVSEPSLEVGGDYYDFIRLDADRLGVVVGDVSGKGVSAAFYMAEVKGIFQALSRVAASPRDLLLRANQALVDSLERNAFISLVYAIFDGGRSTVTLARAGHCPMIHVSGETSRMVRPSGLGLGLTHDRIFEESTQELTISLRSGDICIFYTDGLSESRNAEGEEFGYDRIVDVALRDRKSGAESIKNSILQEIRNYTGNSTYADDMTLVVVKII
ncbi:MAG TPA: PP2C family protein-serine/threonine phosphatase [Bacteroidota bacterium]|nr:PP2C family protein-serine/threonine phosphatase [Bacteroidota bacterium]